MGFKVVCDRCGRFIKNVKATDLKGIMKDEITCKTCLIVEEKIVSRIDILKRKAEAELKKIHATYKDLLTEAIHEQVAKNYDNT